MGQKRRVVALVEDQHRIARISGADDLIAVLLQRLHVLWFERDQIGLPTLEHGDARPGFGHQYHAQLGKTGNALRMPVVQIGLILDELADLTLDELPGTAAEWFLLESWQA